MSYIISVFSMLGLFLICYQRLISLLYLAGRNTLDTVHEIKSSLSGGSGRDAFGIRSMFTNAMQGGGQYGTGLDAIVGFLLSLILDGKKTEKQCIVPVSLITKDNINDYSLSGWQ